MEYTHIQKNINSSPRKLRLVADMVRVMTPAKALAILNFTNKRAALPLSKAIKTAVANTGSKDGVYFKSIQINEGPKLKRMHAGARGRADKFKRRWSHIKIVLTDEVQNVDSRIKSLESSKKQPDKTKKTETKEEK